MPRRTRYVPINERIADYCYDFIPDERLNAGNYGHNPLPEDANEIYEPFDGQERDFFQDGRRKFFAASEDPSAVFGKDFQGGKGAVTETIETMPDGKQVKKRVVTTYEDLEPAYVEEKTSAKQEAEQKERKPMTPMEIMFATQQAMRDVMQRANHTQKRMDTTGIDVCRLAAQCGVNLNEEAHSSTPQNQTEQSHQQQDYSGSAPRDVKINVKRYR